MHDDQLSRLTVREFENESANIYLSAALELGLEYQRLDETSLNTRVFNDNKELRIRSNKTSINRRTFDRLAFNKPVTQGLLHQAGFPVPEFMVVQIALEPLQLCLHHFRSMVLKQPKGSKGKHVHVQIASESDLKLVAQQLIRKGFEQIMAERYIEGSHFRVVVYGQNLIDVIERKHSFAMADGHSNIRELIEALNVNSTGLTGEVPFDMELMRLLHRQGYNQRSVPENGQMINLSWLASNRVGGKQVRIPLDAIPEENQDLFKRATAAVGLNLCGLDVICDDITRPHNGQSFYINEINSRPGMKVHFVAEPGDCLLAPCKILKQYFGL